MSKLSRVVVVGGTSLILLAGAVGASAGSLPPTPTPTEPSVLVAISPCRAVDTRSGGGALINASTTTFDITGTSSFATQGGSLTGCDVPLDATAVSATITVTDTISNGYVTLYPTGDAMPASSSINWFASGQTLASSINVALGGGQLDAFAAGGSAQFVLDITGYYQTGGAGPVGPEGPAGVAGPAGPAGPAGADGVAGPAGADGVAGPAGADGVAGPAGPAGADGVAGPAGPAGADGVAGPAGPAGADGVAGPAGPAGPAGADGVAGPAGPAGPAGADGVAGETGPAGPAGADGAGAILAASGGEPVSVTTILGGLPGTPVLLPLSGSDSEAGPSVLTSTIDTTSAGNVVQVFPRDGTITSISARFSTTQALALVGTTGTITAQLYTSSAGDNTLTAVAGATCTMAPPLTGVLGIGTLTYCTTTGLSIAVTNQTTGVLVISATAAGLSLVNTFTGYASASLTVA